MSTPKNVSIVIKDIGSQNIFVLFEAAGLGQSHLDRGFRARRPIKKARHGGMCFSIQEAEVRGSLQVLV